MFQDNVVITINAITYALPANTPIGIPDYLNSLTVDVVTKALCMTTAAHSQKTKRDNNSIIQVINANEIRVTS